MDPEQKLFSTSLVLQVGFIIWLTAATRKGLAPLGNAHLAVWLTGLLAYFLALFGVKPIQYWFVALLAAGVLVGGVVAKQKKEYFKTLVESYALGVAVPFVFVAFLLRQGDPQLNMRVAVISMAALDLAALGMIAALPQRLELVRFLAGWAVPGLGHWLRGQRGKALFFLGAILSLFLGGLLLTSFRMVGYEDNPFFFYGQFFSGFSLAAGSLLSYEKARLLEGLPYRHFDPGLLYVCVAALLNYVVALNTFDLKSEEPVRPHEPAQPPTTPLPPGESPQKPAEGAA